MRNISKMTRPELVAALKELGEDPPSGWKMIDLRVRLMEMEEEQGIKELRTQNKTDLKTWTTRLNMSMRKKSMGQEFIREELGLVITGNETILELQRMGMNQLYRMTQPSGLDPAGFGEHSEKTYEELKSQNPKYCAWVLKTMTENPEHGLCLSRLGKWLQAGEGNKAKTVPNYMMTPKKETASTKAESSSSSQALLAEMAAQVKALTEEAQELRQERPHKKVEVKPETPQDESMIPKSS